MQFDIVENSKKKSIVVEGQNYNVKISVGCNTSLALTRFHPTEVEPSDGLITRAVTWAGKKVQGAEIKEQFKKLDC